MTRKAIETSGAPAPVGAYNQGIVSGNIVWTAGQVAFDPSTGQLVGGEDVGLQTEQALKNVFAILAAGGASPADIVKVTVFITDASDFKAVNEVYTKLVQQPYPARSIVSVRPFPMGIKVEIEAMAVTESR